MKNILYPFLAVILLSCSPSISSNTMGEKEEVVVSQVESLEEKPQVVLDYTMTTEAQWKEILTPQEFHILREKGTERAFEGEYNTNKEEGSYVCKGCGTELFSSETKFDSGTGWPSFFDIIDGNVENIPDNTYGMKRVEVVCKTCKGHLGHVFTDGPKPKGLRYCINSLSLSFKSKK